MSESTTFRHQDYGAVPRENTYELIEPPEQVKPGSPDFLSIMSAAKSALDRAGVRRIVLVHGTLAGTDALGWYGHWQRVIPSLSKKLKQIYKSSVDQISRGRGNYTQQYAQRLANSLNADAGSPRIEVERFEWTSENHHLGRADAAVRLTDLLLNYHESGERVLLWGHSHAGNVFALVTNLIGCNTKSRRSLISRFFSASHHFHPSTQRIDLAAWKRLESRLEVHADDQDRRLNPTRLDVVTFGTPVRYGWDETGCDNLIHFVNHHPVQTVDPCQAIWPASSAQWVDAIKGEYGDFVQQTFIARSDFPPAIWSWKAWKANRILRDLLEENQLSESRIRRLKKGVRVANSGKSLLVDYALVDPAAKDICGHAVYTDLGWMAFHMQEVATRFYVS